MEIEEKIFLDKKGYEEYLQSISDLLDQINGNSKLKSEAYENGVGDGWHDNFAFEQAKREEFKLLKELHDKREALSRIVIIEEKDNDNTIDINDYVSIEMAFPGEDPEEMIFKLVAANSPNFSSDGISEITLNSPLGKAVYGMKIGDKTSYAVNKNTISVSIKDAKKDLSLLNEKENQRSK